MRLPAWLLHVAGLFDGQLGALPEMLYQWQRPFMVDDSRFRAAFGAAAAAACTPVDAAVAATLESEACTSPSSAASTSAATTSSR